MTTQERPTTTARRTWIWSIVGLSVAAIGIGGALGALRRSHQTNYRYAVAQEVPVASSVGGSGSDLTPAMPAAAAPSEAGSSGSAGAGGAGTSGAARAAIPTSVPTGAKPPVDASPASAVSVAPSTPGAAGSPAAAGSASAGPVAAIALAPADLPSPAVIDARQPLAPVVTPLRGTIEPPPSIPLSDVGRDVGTSPDFAIDPDSVARAREAGRPVAPIAPPPSAVTTTPRPAAEERRDPRASVEQLRGLPRAFVDPCTRKRLPKGCGRGINGTVLAIQSNTEPSPTISVQQVGAFGLMNGDCVDQLGQTGDDPLLAIMSNVPLRPIRVVATPYWDANTPDVRAGDPGDVLTFNPTQSPARIAMWERAFQSESPTPSIPSCLRIPKYIAEKYKRQGSTLFSLKIDALSRQGLSVNTTTDGWLLMVETNNRYAVEIHGVTSSMLRVRTTYPGNTADPMTVVSVGFPWDVPCSAYDRYTDQPYPLTYQFGRTSFVEDGPNRVATSYLGLPPRSPSMLTFHVCTYFITVRPSGAEITMTEDRWVTAPTRARYDVRIVRENGLTDREIRSGLRLTFRQLVEDAPPVSAPGFSTWCGLIPGQSRFFAPSDGPLAAPLGDRWCVVRGRELLDQPSRIVVTAELEDELGGFHRASAGFDVDPRGCFCPGNQTSQRVVFVEPGSPPFLSLDIVRDTADNDAPSTPEIGELDENGVTQIARDEWIIDARPPQRTGLRDGTSSSVALDTQRSVTTWTPTGAVVTWSANQALRPIAVAARVARPESNGPDAPACPTPQLFVDEASLRNAAGRPVTDAARNGTLAISGLCRNVRYDIGVLYATRDRRRIVFQSTGSVFNGVADGEAEQRLVPSLALLKPRNGGRIMGTVRVRLPDDLAGRSYSIRLAEVQVDGVDVIGFPSPSVALPIGAQGCTAPAEVRGPATGAFANPRGTSHVRISIVVLVGADCDTAERVVFFQDRVTHLPDGATGVTYSVRRDDGAEATVDLSWRR